MKANFLKIAGVNSEAEFYQKFPSEEAFFAAHPEAQMMKSGGNTPTNPALWSRAKAAARAKYDVYPSAYANGWAAKWYKSKGGGWRKAEYGGMMAEGGVPNNPGFNALPDAVQQNIIDNMAYGGGTNNPGFEALPEYVQAKILSNMAEGGQMPAEIARARFAAAGNLDKMDDYGYMYGGDTEMEQMRDGGIPERYRNMGFTSVGTKKNSTRPGKKWMVLAKKGDDYKVVHGGYDGMKDYSQHGSEQRKENFWNRMGGKNSAKATDPFSPLYWHKRFGTWQSGGEPMRFLPDGYINPDWVRQSQSIEADRSGDAMVISKAGQKLMEDKLAIQRQQEAFARANPDIDREALRKQLINKYGTMKDGDFIPNEAYFKARGRYVPTEANLADSYVKNYTKGYKKGGSTYSGGVWFEEGGIPMMQVAGATPKIASSTMWQTALGDAEMEAQAAADMSAFNTTTSANANAVIGQQVQQQVKTDNPALNLNKKPTFNGMMGAVQDKLMDQYTNPFSMTNVANYAGNFIDGINNKNNMKDAQDKQRQSYSTDYAYMPTVNNAMSRGQYDMYGQMVPDKIGGNLSFTGMNQKYSAGVPRFAEGGLSDFDYIADIATPEVSIDPMAGLRNYGSSTVAPADATRVAAPAPMEMAPSTPDNVDIRKIIGSKESNNNYGALPKGKDGKLASSAVGKYQFLWEQHKKTIASVTGITSKEEFRRNPEAQEKFFDYWNNNILTPVANDIKSRFKPNLSMNDIKQIVHFQGPGGAKKFFATGNYTKDAFGSDPLSYIKKKYAEGGEIEVSEEELAQILKMGGQVEYC